MKKIIQNITTNISIAKTRILIRWIERLNHVIKQLNHTGINSETSKYIYQPSTKKYVSNFDNYDYPKLTDNVENAIDFQNIPFSKTILWRLNMQLEESNHFFFRTFIKLSGGDFGSSAPRVNIDNNAIADSVEKSLSDFDNLNLDDM